MPTLGIMASAMKLRQTYPQLILRQPNVGDPPVTSYWQLNDASGAVAVDSTALRNGTINGTVTYGVSGPIVDNVPGMTFPGTAGTFISATDGSYVMGDVLSYEAWIIRGATGAVRGIVSGGPSGGYMRLDASAFVSLLKAGTGIIVGTTQTIPASGWHHVVCTKNGTTTKIYIDGVDRTGTPSNQTLVGNSHLTIGSDNNGSGTDAENFNGSIAQVAVYSSELTAATVLAHYNKGIGA